MKKTLSFQFRWSVRDLCKKGVLAGSLSVSLMATNPLFAHTRGHYVVAGCTVPTINNTLADIQTTPSTPALLVLQAQAGTASNALTYQWYKAASTFGSGTAITGATDSTYDAQSAAVGETYYYCVVTDVVCSTSALSNRVKVTIKNTPIAVNPAISIAPGAFLQNSTNRILQVKATGFGQIAGIQGRINLGSAVTRIISVNLSQDALNAGMKESDIDYSDVNCAGCNAFSFVYDNTTDLAVLNNKNLFDVQVQMAPVSVAGQEICSVPFTETDKLKLKFATVADDGITVVNYPVATTFGSLCSFNPQITNPPVDSTLYDPYDPSNPTLPRSIHACSGTTVSIPFVAMQPALPDGYSYALYIADNSGAAVKQAISPNVIGNTFNYPVGDSARYFTAYVKAEADSGVAKDLEVMSPGLNYHVNLVPALSVSGTNTDSTPLCPTVAQDVFVSVSNMTNPTVKYDYAAPTADIKVEYLNGTMILHTGATTTRVNSTVSGIIATVAGCTSSPVDVVEYRGDKIAPTVVTAGTDMTVYTDPGQKLVTLDPAAILPNAPVFTDNCAPQLTITTTGYAPATGAGANQYAASATPYTLIYTATDNDSNATSASITLTVVQRPALYLSSTSVKSFSGDKQGVDFKLSSTGTFDNISVSGTFSLGANAIGADLLPPGQTVIDVNMDKSFINTTYRAVLTLADYKAPANGGEDCAAPTYAIKSATFTSGGKSYTLDVFKNFGDICITDQRIIEGVVRDFNGTTLSNATVMLTDKAGQPVGSSVTPDKTGHYRFVLDNAAAPTQVSAVYNNATGDHNLAAQNVNIGDVLAVRRYLVSKRDLTNFEKILADVNNDTTLDNTDIIMTRQFINNTRDYFMNTKNVKSRFNLYNNSDYLNGTQNINLTSANIHNPSMDFVAYTIGDADYADADNKKALNTLAVELGSSRVVSGTHFAIPVLAGEDATVAAYQFSMNWDSNVIRFTGIENMKNDIVTGTEQAGNGKIALNWISSKNVNTTVKKGDLLFILNFNAVGQIGDSTMVDICSDIASAVAFQEQGEKMNISSTAAKITIMDSNGINQAAGNYGISNAMPNPFRSDLKVQFALPAKQEVTITVFNTFGQVLSSTSVYEEGTNVWNLPNPEQLPAGLYTLQFKTDGIKQVLKVIKD